MIVVAQQAVRRALHHHDVLGMRPDAAENPKDRLYEERRLDQTPIKKMPQRVEMPDVIALDFKAGAIPGAGREDVLDVREGILEHARARSFQIGLLPLVFE